MATTEKLAFRVPGIWALNVHKEGKMERATQIYYIAWIDEENKVVSFQAAEGFEEKRFQSHDEMFAFVIEKSRSGYRIQ